jgi:hypothetical protein
VIEMEKSVIVNGPCADLEDVVKIARDVGKRVLGVDRVRVKPFLAPYGNGSYVVVVEEEAGCCKAPVGVRGR